MRHQAESSDTELELSTEELRRRNIARAIDAMQRRLAESVSLSELAKIAAMSRFHFDRVFRQVTGLSPFQFLSAIRLAKACDLLLTTNQSVTEVCLSVGYNSLGTFTRRFSAMVGASPRRVRHEARSLAQSLASDEQPTSDGAAARATAVRVQVGGDVAERLIFVGAFTTPLPLGRPIACALVTTSGPLTLSEVPEGTYYFFAAGLLKANPLAAWIEADLRVAAAAANPITIRQGSPVDEIVLELRRVAPTDPPILTFLPLMLREQLGDVQ
jgi:AraC-like DNA-binding protein